MFIIITVLPILCEGSFETQLAKSITVIQKSCDYGKMSTCGTFLTT